MCGSLGSQNYQDIKPVIHILKIGYYKIVYVFSMYLAWSIKSAVM